MMQAVVRSAVDTLALSVLRHRTPLRSGLLRAAAGRGRSLVLCYHRVAPDRAPVEVVEPLHPDVFGEHMEALRECGDVVPLDWLVAHPGHRRPTFAVTLDDDDAGHVLYTLPILRRLNIPATFFLSGRALHGLGPYWWTVMQQAILENGLDATCRELGLPPLPLRELVRTCRRRAAVKDMEIRAASPAMTVDDIRSLASAGMAIGFHTLHHPALTMLDDRELEEAVTQGRDELTAVAGTPMAYFAYPYGTTDGRVAAAVQRAGYRAAFALGDRAATGGGNPFLIPRWQPGPLKGQELAAAAAVRLNWRTK